VDRLLELVREMVRPLNSAVEDFTIQVRELRQAVVYLESVLKEVIDQGREMARED
jgi:hypothetical protein